MIMRADRNHDSLISADEYLADAGRRFGRLDENGDGTVEKAEVDRAAERIAKRIRAGMERALSRNDADGDGKVTRAESDAAASKRFASLDEDADGSLRPADFRRRREPAKQVEAETSRAN